MGLLDRLRRTDPDAGDGVQATLDRIMAMQPQLRLARLGRKRLAPAVATALAHVRALVEALPAAREASAAAWADDPYIHAWFAAPDEVPAVLSRSAVLRACFHDDHGAGTAPPALVHAVLGMAMGERHTLGVAEEGGTLRRDVPRTTVNFSDHQLRVCAGSEAALRADIVRRLLDQLALEGLAHTVADKSRRAALERERALLKTRLHLLERQGGGIRAVFGSDATADSGELARLQAQLGDNAHSLADLGLREDAVERTFEHVRAVFAQPGAHLAVSTRRLWLDRMNVVLEPGSTCDGAELVLRIARLLATPSRVRAFALVRCARAELLPEKSMFDEAAQLLSSGL